VQHHYWSCVCAPSNHQRVCARKVIFTQSPFAPFSILINLIICTTNLLNASSKTADFNIIDT
jgi:hypothetical protein